MACGFFSIKFNSFYYLCKDHDDVLRIYTIYIICVFPIYIINRDDNSLANLLYVYYVTL